MIPVHRPTADKMDWAMPFPQLFARLQERTQGRILQLDEGRSAERPDSISDYDWDDFVARTTVTKDWIDVRIALGD